MQHPNNDLSGPERVLSLFLTGRAHTRVCPLLFHIRTLNHLSSDFDKSENIRRAFVHRLRMAGGNRSSPSSPIRSLHLPTFRPFIGPFNQHNMTVNFEPHKELQPCQISQSNRPGSRRVVIFFNLNAQNDERFHRSGSGGSG